MKKIKIITDSLSDVPANYIEEYDIDVLPLGIIFGEDYYRDGVDLTKKEFYERLTSSPVTPKTSQINPAAFQEVYERYTDCPVLYVGSSSKASGTYQSGVMAKELTGRSDVYTYDTMMLSIGAGLMVIEAAELAKEGKAIDSILERLEEMKTGMHTFFTVDTLEFLERGGRITKAKSIIGTMLSIKPILTIEEGLVVPHDSVRGKKKVNERVFSLLEKAAGDLKGETIGLVHANAPEEMKVFKDELLQLFSPQRIIESEIGAAIGTHSGPGTVAIFFLKK